MSKEDASTFCPKNPSEWRKWLKENHDTATFIWLVYFKSSSKKPSLSWSQAVDEALCFGWIDSTKKSIDEERYMQYFCPRKATSNWSRVNKNKVDRLIQNNRMTKAGLKSIAIAKENGSWTFLDKIESLVVPQDLKIALSKLQVANDFFEALSNSDKKNLLYWVLSAKRTQTRKKRITEVALNAQQKMKPKQFR